MKMYITYSRESGFFQRLTDDFGQKFDIFVQFVFGLKMI